jgi:KaiC/GvpD/RAD55 family RecA-like ATPase
MNKLLEKDGEGVFVTFNKTSNDLEKVFLEQELDLKRVHFVDAVTLMIDGNKSKNGETEYIESPSELVEVSMAAEKALKKLSAKKKFIVIDSITTLLVYNSDISVEKFSHALAQKILDWNVKGIFLMTDSTSKKIVDTIAQFCDKTERI